VAALRYLQSVAGDGCAVRGYRIIVKMGRVRYVLVTLFRCVGWWP